MDRTIHPNDEPFAYARLNGKTAEQFLSNAERLVGFISGLVQEHRPDLMSGARLLDFGCGHGRLARFFPEVFQPASFHCADIWSEAAKFCRRFGGEPVVVRDDQSLNGLTFDLIVSVSVFSHLPPIAFEHYLKALSRSLDNGLLVFSYVPIAEAVRRHLPVSGDYYFGLKNDIANVALKERPADDYAFMAVTERFLRVEARRAGLEILTLEPDPGSHQVFAVTQQRL